MVLSFAQWLEAQQWSQDLHGSFYMYNWIESTHVMTLMLSLGMLCVIDLRLLGVAFMNVPASRMAQRLEKPMIAGFIIMFITGILLFYGIPVRTSQSLWFRIKMVLLVAAFINMFTFNRYMEKSVSTWDTAPTPPSRARIAAVLSLTFWAGIVVCGRFIAYDWFDCNQTDNSEFIRTLSGCVAQ
jgi:hypothetical protein